MSLNSALRNLTERLGWVVHRWPATRFDGMRHALQLLHARGYRPQLVIDCGANTGQWFQLAEHVFPDARYCLVEPQPACAVALERLRVTRRRMTVYKTAVTEPGVSTVLMMGGGDGTNTGNFVAQPQEALGDGTLTPATTLDCLFASETSSDQRTLLKLDVERHELAVLRGATTLLRQVEVVLSETGIYDIAGNRPVFGDLMTFMIDNGFEFYDIAALSGRTRDQRLRQMDVIFVRGGSSLLTDHAWD